ncbi:hypothetical protein BAJUN_00560 [Bajunvirus bajun]|uniref:Uncharacterized protein n=1 Tax=Brevundimonas phage vB_BgoS-Bajun TaxID=2948594 RepID=A0A9E7N7I5_9CAUD|nr:hypothetical protein BAJUN_00560 [Brevundimonas phage vB_BgoS-Bajun]
MAVPKHPWGLIADPNDPEGRIGVVGLTDHLPPYLVTQADDRAILDDLKVRFDAVWSGSSQTITEARTKLVTDFRALGADSLIDIEATVNAAIARYTAQRQARWRHLLAGVASCPIPLKPRSPQP